MADLKRSTDFNHLIRVLSVQGRFEEAWLRVLPEMDKRGIKRTAFTFSALLAGAAEDRNPEVAEWVSTIPVHVIDVYPCMMAMAMVMVPFLFHPSDNF